MNYAQQAGTAVTASPLPVHAAHNELDNAVGQLHETIGALSERLQQLLGPSKPQGVENNPKGPPTSPTLANRTYSAASSIHAARMRVVELLDRLEI